LIHFQGIDKPIIKQGEQSCKKVKFTPYSILLFIPILLFSKPAELEPRDVNAKVNEFLFTHITQKKLTLELMKRAFDNFVTELDPLKTYFIKDDVDAYLNPSEELLSSALEGFYKSDFTLFNTLHQKMVSCIERRSELESNIKIESLLDHVDTKELESSDWTTSTEELSERLLKIKSLHKITADKLEEPDLST